MHKLPDRPAHPHFRCSPCCLCRAPRRLPSPQPCCCSHLRPYSAYLEDLTSGELGSCYTRRAVPANPEDRRCRSALPQDRGIPSPGAGRPAACVQLYRPFWSIPIPTNDNRLPRSWCRCLAMTITAVQRLVGEQFRRGRLHQPDQQSGRLVQDPAADPFDEFVGTFDHRTQELSRTRSRSVGQNGSALPHPATSISSARRPRPHHRGSRPTAEETPSSGRTRPRLRPLMTTPRSSPPR